MSDSLSFVERLALAAPGLIWKSTLLLAAAELAVRGLRRRSAAARHLVCCLALAGILGLPFLSAGVPGWDLHVLPPEEPDEALVVTPVEVAPADVPIEEAARDPLPRDPAMAIDPRAIGWGPSERWSPFVGDLPPIAQKSDEPVALAPPVEETPPTPAAAPVVTPARSAAAWLVPVWGLGALLCILPPLVGRFLLIRLARKARPLTSGKLAESLRELSADLGLSRHVRLFQSRAATMPMTWGWLRPVILLPADSATWSDDRRRSVLLHELAHIRRRDWLADSIARAACALYWFHPLAWLAARHLRVERERACDDLVLRTGARPSDYAEHLLEMARDLRTARGTSIAALAIAQPSQLEGRLLAILDPACRRGNLGRMTALVALGVLFAVVVPLAVIRLTARTDTIDEAGTALTEAAAVIGDAGADKADQTKSDDMVTVRGRVVLPDGKPAAGATVRAAAPLWAMMTEVVGDDFVSPLTETKTDGEGSFSIRFTTQPFGDVSRLDERWQEIWKKTAVAASLDGYGPAWVEYEDVEPDQPVTLRLVEDLPIRGRVVDLEGRPIAGTVVKIGEPRAAKEEDLTPWLEGIKAGELPWTVYDKAGRTVESRVVGLPTSVTTTADGKLEIRGLGRERIVALTFGSESVAHRGAIAATRRMEPIRQVISRPPFEGTEPVFGTEFTFTADPSRPIEGVVRDATTGDALAGVSVESDKLADYPYAGHRVLKTTTDATGRFRLVGMPKGAGNRLLLVPNDDQPYLMRQFELPDPAGLGPVGVEIDLHRGVMITGRVTDKVTGDPVPGVRLHYLPFLSNEFAQKTPEFGTNFSADGDQMRYRTRADGTYRLVGLPGRAIVGAEAVMRGYLRGVGFAEIDAPMDTERGGFATYGNPVQPGRTYPTAMREINPAADATAITLDFQLDPGKSVRVRVTGPGGEPLSGVSVTGLSWDGHVEATREPVLTAVNLAPDDKRTLLLHHKKSNVGLAFVISPEQIRAGEASVALQPCATVTGRVVNEDGEPITGLAVRADLLPEEDWTRSLPTGVVDAAGRFRLTLLPGSRYALNGEGGGFDRVAVARELSIEPGETKDLGTIRFDKDGEAMAAEMRPGRGSVKGRVLDPSGKPFSGAKVYVVRSTATDDSEPTGMEVLERTTSDSGGGFSFSLPSEPSRVVGTSGFVNRRYEVIATARGFGLDWEWVDPTAKVQELGLRLVPDTEPIAGRIVDLEGKPVAGVRVRINSITAASSSVEEWIAQAKKSSVPAGADPGSRFPGGKSVSGGQLPGMAEIVSGPDGRFTLAGIGNDRLANLTLSGETIARTLVDVITHPMEPVSVVNANPRSRTRRYFGSRFDYSAEPTQVVTGTVLDADSRQPLPGVRVAAYQYGESTLSLEGEPSAITDGEGRYRIVGLPKAFGPANRSIRLRLVPDPSQPYFLTTTNVPRGDALAPIVHDITLKRAAWVTGRILDKATGEPVPALVVYYPFQDNPHASKYPNFEPGIRMLHHDPARPAAADGSYRVPAVPGRGVVMAIALDDQSYRTAEGAEELGLQRTPSGEPRLVYHIHSVDLANSVRLVQIDEQGSDASRDIALVPHEKQTIRMRDAEGKPLAGVIAGGLLARTPLLRGYSTDLYSAPAATDDTLSVVGLEVDQRRLLLLVHKERQLGRALVVERGVTTEVRLQPCATLSGRVVDPAGKPVADAWVSAKVPDSEFPGPRDWQSWRYSGRGGSTDKEGRFKLDTVIPGVRYVIGTDRANSIDVDVVEPGSSKDIGTLTLPSFKPGAGEATPKPDEKPPASGATASAPANEGAAPGATKADSKAADLRNPKSEIRNATDDDPTYTYAYAGMVVDTEGKPVAGAKVSVEDFRDESTGSDAPAAALTDRQGRFRFSRRKDQASDGQSGLLTQARIVATREGYGFAAGPSRYFEVSGRLEADMPYEQRKWMEEDDQGSKADVLVLVPDDVPVRGRVLDVDGQPVVGATIQAVHIQEGIDGTLDAWDAEAKRDGANSTSLDSKLRFLIGSQRLRVPQAVGASPARTDSNGRFRLQGLGRDRIASIVISATGFETTQSNVRSRRGEIVRVVNNPDEPDSGFDSYHPNEFTLVVGPSVPVEGRVIERKTTRPVAGALVSARGGWSGRVSSVTDANGWYRLEGLPIARPTSVTVVPPVGTRHLPMGARLTTAADSKSLGHDFMLTEGVLVRGRLTDKRTGQPIRARLTYYAFPSNPHRREAVGFQQAGPNGYWESDGDGRFAVPVLPGEGILAINAGVQYPRGVWSVPPDGSGVVKRPDNAPQGFFAENHSLVSLIAPRPGTEELLLDLQLTSGATVSGRVRSPEGEIVRDYQASGLYSHAAGFSGFYRIPGETFGLEGYFPSERRVVTFYQPKTNLVGRLTLSGEPPRNLEVKLRPGARIVGRIVDSNGNPLEDVIVRDGFARVMDVGRAEQPSEDPGRGVFPTHEEGRSILTDKNGRFVISGIIPGLKYSADAEGPKEVRGKVATVELGALFTDILVDAAETRDLGNLTPTDYESKNGAATTAAEQTAAATPTSRSNQDATGPGADPRAKEGDTITLRGRVIDAAGKPLAGVTFYAHHFLGDYAGPRRIEWRVVGTSDASGRFSVEAPYRVVQAGSVDKPVVVVHQPGMGLHWIDLSPTSGGVDHEVVLKPEQVVRGRFLDTEGRPIAGVQVHVRNIQVPAPGGSLDAYLDAHLKNWAAVNIEGRKLQALFYPVVSPLGADPQSAADGWVTLAGLPPDAIATVTVQGDSIASMFLRIVNRRNFDPKPYFDQNPDRTMRQGPGQFTTYSADFTHIAEQGLTIEGRVVTEKNEPAAEVGIHAGDFPMGAFPPSLGQTDADGRYRLTGLKRNARLTVSFTPGEGSDLLSQRTTVESRLGEEQVRLDVTMHRGVVVTGRVTDRSTGAAVAAQLTAYPLRDNEFIEPRSDTAQAVLDDSVRTDADGRFRLSTIPGRVLIAVTATGNRIPLGDRGGISPFRAVTFTDDERERLRGVDMAFLRSQHAAKFMKLAPGERGAIADFELDRGKTVDVRFVDADGAALENVLISGLSERIPKTAQLTEPRVTVYALGTDRPRKIVARHDARRLAGVFTLTGDERSPVVLKLTPAASMRGRAVDEMGQPLRNATLLLRFTGAPDDNTVHLLYQTEQPAPTTDGDGRFEIPALIPGEAFALTAQANGRILQHKSPKESYVPTAGEDLNLGDAVFAPPGQRPAAPAAAPVEEPSAKRELARASQAPKTTEDKPAAAPSDNFRNPKSEIRNAEDSTFEYVGTVVDRDGKPVAGANVKLEYGRTNAAVQEVATLATTDATGRFRFSRRKSDFLDADYERMYRFAHLVVTKDGYGFALKPSYWFETTGKVAAEIPEENQGWMEQDHGGKSTILTLVPDVPVRGRVLDVEGRPVVGARIEALNVAGGRDGTLDAWEAATKEPNAHYDSVKRQLRTLASGMFRVRSRASAVPVTQTGADGWFTLKGLGRERIAEIFVSGAGIETQLLLVRSRSGALIKVRRGDDVDDDPNDMVTFHPNEFTCVVGPSRTVEGRVTDKQTERPIAGASVRFDKFAFFSSRLLQTSGASYIRTQTDVDGRYRLEGLPLEEYSPITVQPPHDSPHFKTRTNPRIGAGNRSFVHDVALPRGVIVRGRVADERTGQPVRGQLHYFAFQSNPHVAAAGFSRTQLRFDAVWNDEDGSFSIIALPGKGMLAFSADDHDHFLRGAGSERMVVDPADRTTDGKIRTIPTDSDAGNFHFVAPLDPDPNAAEVTVALKPIRGATVLVKPSAPDGQALHDFYVFDSFGGETPSSGWRHIKLPQYEIKGYFPQQKRWLMFCDPERNLAGTLDLTGEAPRQVEVTLRPGATLIGRVVDRDGVPIEDAYFENAVRPRVDGDTISDRSFGRLLTFRPDYVRTDAKGRFEFKGIIPGLKYSALVSNPESRGYDFAPIFTDVIAQPGEVKNLGDLRPKREEPLEPLDKKREADKPGAAQPAKASAATPPLTPPAKTSDTNTVRGRVVDQAGKPVAKAHVALIGNRNALTNGGDYPAYSEAVAQGTTDAEGRFELRPKGISSETHRDARLIVRAEGAGITWKVVDPDAPTLEAVITLPTEQPIRVRLIDIEGRPAAGVRLVLGSVDAAPPSEGRTDAVGYRRFDVPPLAWVPTLIADAEGRLTIRNIPPGHGVFLGVEGNERFARQQLAINTGMLEQREERDATYRSLVKNARPDDEVVLALAPAQIIEGVVRYEDTNEPAPYARLSVWASQGESSGSMISMSGIADAQGRYRISPYAGVRFGVMAYPPAGAPYLVREIRDIIRKDPGSAKPVDLTLRRGVLVRGRVLEAGTQTPVAGASIQYLPQPANRNVTEDTITGWQGIRVSNEQGIFEIVVLPGPGTLAVHAASGSFVLEEVSSRQLARGTPGGDRRAAHAFRKIDPTPQSEPIDVTLELTRGATVSGRITDQAGEPVSTALVLTGQHVSYSRLRWSQFPNQVLGGRFEIPGLAAGREYPVHFLDPEHERGATLLVRASEPNPTSVLLPCGKATAKFITAEGKPRVDFVPDIEFVMTPGRHRLDARKAEGELRAESTFVANIDRLHYWNGPKTDAEGRVTFPALIPGARYCILLFDDNDATGHQVAKEFIAESGKTLDLGEFKVVTE